MMFTRIAASTSMVAAVAVAAAGIAQAAPSPTVSSIQQEIRYNTKLVDKTVVTTLDGGTFEISPDKTTVDINDQAGNAVVRLPLSFNLDHVSHALNAAIEGAGTVLKLTPDVDLATTRPVLVKQVASPVEDQRALSMFNSYLGVGTAAGGLVGTAVGVVVGGVAGCVLGLSFFAVGCVPAAVAGAGIGGILGTVVVGGPILIYSAIDLISTLTAPPGTTKYSDERYKGTSPTPATPGLGGS